MSPFSYPGKLFVFEGLDGSGKTSLLQNMITELERSFPETLILTAKEPGKTPVGEEVREILLRNNRELKDIPTELTECLLFSAARAQLIAQFIRPNLAKGAWIFLDRFTLSTYAYQSATGALCPQFIKNLTQNILKEISPTLTIFLDAPIETCQLRLKASQKTLDRIEKNSEEFFKKVYQRYHQEIKQSDEPIVILDACDSQARLLSQALEAISPYLKCPARHIHSST